MFNLCLDIWLWITGELALFLSLQWNPSLWGWIYFNLFTCRCMVLGLTLILCVLGHLMLTGRWLLLFTSYWCKSFFIVLNTCFYRRISSSSCMIYWLRWKKWLSSILFPTPMFRSWNLSFKEYRLICSMLAYHF